MQVKKNFNGKSPKLCWGFKLVFPIGCALGTIGITVGELYYGMHPGLILATFLLGGLVTAFFLYVSEGYTLTVEGLFYSTLLGRILGRKELLIAWEDVQEIYLTMRLVDIVPSGNSSIMPPYKTYSECIIITTEKSDRLLTYKEAISGYNEKRSFAFALYTHRDELNMESKNFDRRVILRFLKDLGLKITDRRQEHPYYHDPELQKKLYGNHYPD